MSPSPKLPRSVARGAAALAIVASTYGLVGASVSGAAVTATSKAPTATSSVNSVSHAKPTKPTNARSGPEEGGSVGKVQSVSTTGFAVATSASEKVTVKVTASTKFEMDGKVISALGVTKGTTILVLGITNSATITADQIIVEPANSPFAAKTKDVPFRKGAASTSKQFGTIPTNYKQGSGTIVSGTVANKAITAALAVFPGGTVDRVVKISSTEYEVHNIGVNWPHHIFVNQNFKVVGAN